MAAFVVCNGVVWSDKSDVSDNLDESLSSIGRDGDDYSVCLGLPQRCCWVAFIRSSEAFGAGCQKAVCAILSGRNC